MLASILLLQYRWSMQLLLHAMLASDTLTLKVLVVTIDTLGHFETG